MKLIKKKPDIIFYLSLLIFSYVNIFFYRIAEHGVDKSPQILLFIIILDIIILFSHYKKKLNFNILQKNTLLILTLIFFAASIKQIYFLYFLLIPLLYFKINFFKEILNKNKLLIIIFFASLLLNQLTSFFSTGCFLYPEEKIGYSGGLIAGLVSRIPHKIAMEILLMGKQISSKRAYEFGLA